MLPWIFGLQGFRYVWRNKQKVRNGSLMMFHVHCIFRAPDSSDIYLQLMFIFLICRLLVIEINACWTYLWVALWGMWHVQSLLYKRTWRKACNHSGFTLWPALKIEVLLCLLLFSCYAISILCISTSAEKFKECYSIYFKCHIIMNWFTSHYNVTNDN